MEYGKNEYDVMAHQRNIVECESAAILTLRIFFNFNRFLTFSIGSCAYEDC